MKIKQGQRVVCWALRRTMVRYMTIRIWRPTESRRYKDTVGQKEWSRCEEEETRIRILEYKWRRQSSISET